MDKPPGPKAGAPASDSTLIRNRPPKAADLIRGRDPLAPSNAPVWIAPNWARVNEKEDRTEVPKLLFSSAFRSLFRGGEMGEVSHNKAWRL